MLPPPPVLLVVIVLHQALILEGHVVHSGPPVPRRGASSRDVPTPEFRDHRVVQPKILHGPTQAEIWTTEDLENRTRQHHLRDVTLVLPGGEFHNPNNNSEGNNILVDLKLTESLIPDSYFEKTHENVSDTFCLY